MKTMEVITNGNIEVKIDDEGRWCLNDIRRAWLSQNPHVPKTRKLPNDWARLSDTEELFEEAQKREPEIEVFSSNRTTGSYATRGLALCFAGWLSPAMHLDMAELYWDWLRRNLDAEGPYGNSRMAPHKTDSIGVSRPPLTIDDHARAASPGIQRNEYAARLLLNVMGYIREHTILNRPLSEDAVGVAVLKAVHKTPR